MKTNVKITLSVLGLLVLLGAMSFVFNSPTGNVIKNGGGVPLTILNYEVVDNTDGSLSINGIAENTAGKQLSYAEITVKFYNSDGELLASSSDSANDLVPGEKWNFEIRYPGPDKDQVYSYSGPEVSVGSVQ